MADAPVVISGAGPVGLSLAFGLAMQGVRSVVLEKKPRLSAHSKAVVVLTRTCEVLEQWGLLDRFKLNSDFVQHFKVHDAGSGKVLIDVDFSSLDPISNVAGVCVLPQDETERLLYEACAATGLVDVRFDSAVVAFDSDESGVRTRVEALDRQYVLESEFLCGCDGPKSAVRHGLGFELQGKTYRAHAVLADVRITDERDALPWPRGNLRKKGIRAAVRFGAGRWRIILAQPGDTDEAPPTPEFVQERVEELIGPGQAEVLWAGAFKIHLRNAPKFRFGRVMLLGDAAHLNSPAGGQGMNGGIQDAHNLAWKIPQILAGADAETLLASYEEERYDAITRGVDVASDRFTRFGIFMPPWIRRIVFVGLKLALRSESLRRRILGGFGMLIHRADESDLIDKTGGMLLPNLLLADGSRLRSHLPQGGVIEVKGGEVEIDGADMLLAPGASQYLKGPYVAVRPDHIVAYQGRSAAKAIDYAARWLPEEAAIDELPGAVEAV